MWGVNIVEGKDWPHERGPKDFRSLGNNVGIMLQMCEPIFRPVKCLVFYSSFCVAEGIADLQHIGVYVAAITNTR